ncbi:MAG: hypothetical protein EBX07_00705 [Burkholderiaceae bacterium]|nr:hypothetical protein [Burkholderiaceae bacterium]
MRLSDASVAIRPRTAWEAMDLGVLMAREHRLLLTASWALVSSALVSRARVWPGLMASPNLVQGITFPPFEPETARRLFESAAAEVLLL